MNKILKELKPSISLMGDAMSNLNFRLPKELLMKLNIKASYDNKFLKDYLIQLIAKDVMDVEVKFK